MSNDRCDICDAEFRTGDYRMRNELRGICLMCAKEGGFAGMTLEETARCVAMLKVIADYQKSTAAQRRHIKDQES